ncbi:hypothetical protein ABMA28_010753, partial [Loxostege sticticalis]
DINIARAERDVCGTGHQQREGRRRRRVPLRDHVPPRGGGLQHRPSDRLPYLHQTEVGGSDSRRPTAARRGRPPGPVREGQGRGRLHRGGGQAAAGGNLVQEWQED